jgi:hypothetical protein
MEHHEVLGSNGIFLCRPFPSTSHTKTEHSCVENGEFRTVCELHSLMACVAPKDYKMKYNTYINPVHMYMTAKGAALHVARLGLNALRKCGKLLRCTDVRASCQGNVTHCTTNSVAFMSPSNCTFASLGGLPHRPLSFVYLVFLVN